MSKRTSGVKKFVSNIGDFSRGVPFIQPISPTANGVCKSIAGAGGGACKASAMIAAVLATIGEGGEGVALGAPVGPSAATEELVAGPAAGTFMTTSRRVALFAMTCSAGTFTSGVPSTCTVSDQTPEGRSAKEYPPSLPDTVDLILPPARTAVTVAPPTGAFVAFVTTPTIVPSDDAVIGIAGSYA